jgi:hypothetical protein
VENGGGIATNLLNDRAMSMAPPKIDAPFFH